MVLCYYMAKHGRSQPQYDGEARRQIGSVTLVLCTLPHHQGGAMKRMQRACVVKMGLGVDVAWPSRRRGQGHGRDEAAASWSRGVVCS
jgi:hypothetical protein